MAMRQSVCQVALVIGLTSASPAIERTIDKETARKLIEEALPGLGESRTSVRILPWRFFWAPEFYTFSASRAGDRGVLLTYYFAVNPWTGDVWDAIGCKRITTPETQREQESIWKRSGIPTEAREVLRNKSPADCSIYMERSREEKK